jgi:hypothetical protein
MGGCCLLPARHGVVEVLVRTASPTSIIAATITMSTTTANKTAAMVCTVGVEAAASPTGSDRDDEKSRHFDEIEIEVLLGQLLTQGRSTSGVASEVLSPLSPASVCLRVETVLITC